MWLCVFWVSVSCACVLCRPAAAGATEPSAVGVWFVHSAQRCSGTALCRVPQQPTGLCQPGPAAVLLIHHALTPSLLRACPVAPARRIRPIHGLIHTLIRHSPPTTLHYASV